MIVGKLLEPKLVWPVRLVMKVHNKYFSFPKCVRTKLHLCLFVQDEVAKQSAMLIYETALVESGFNLENPKDFAKRLYTVIKANLNLSPDAEAENEEEADEEGEKESPVEEGEMTDGFVESDEVSDCIFKLINLSSLLFQLRTTVIMPGWLKL